MSDLTPDVLILGAGINGAGLFRDLCEQGVSCMIVERNDYGSGTSSAPSRLIHGGLKYLETVEFRLVAQSTLERNLLLQNAPHTVQALPTVIPIFSFTKGIWAALRTLMGSSTAPRSRGAVLIKIGLSRYDHYGSRSRVMPRHGMKLRKAALAQMPALTTASSPLAPTMRPRSAAPNGWSGSCWPMAWPPTRPPRPSTTPP